jgi:hypothetical protein
MQILQWCIKFFLALVLIGVGLFAGAVFVEDDLGASWYFGAVIFGFGVLGALLILSALTWFIVGWRRQGSKGLIATALATLLVAFSTLTVPFAHWQDRHTNGSSIAWIEPFSALGISIPGIPSDALGSYLEQRELWQANEGKEQTRHALNTTTSIKDYGWNLGRLKLISRVSANAQEYEAWRQASMRDAFERELGREVSIARSTDKLAAWAHLATPTLRTAMQYASQSHLLPPPFSVKPDYATAIAALNALSEISDANAARYLPMKTEAMQLACKTDPKMCGGIDDSASDAMRALIVAYESRKSELEELAKARSYSVEQIAKVYEYWEQDSQYILKAIQVAPQAPNPAGQTAARSFAFENAMQEGQRISDIVSILRIGMPEQRTEKSLGFYLPDNRLSQIAETLAKADTEGQKLLALLVFDHAMVSMKQKWFE